MKTAAQRLVDMFPLQDQHQFPSYEAEAGSKLCAGLQHCLLNPRRALLPGLM